jgi:hypothetical protein
MLVVNTNRGGHAVIGLYFAKALLAARYAVTVRAHHPRQGFRQDEEAPLLVLLGAIDLMATPPVVIASCSCFSWIVVDAKACRSLRVSGQRWYGVSQLADTGVVVGGTSFGTMLDNKCKDLDTVKYVR